MARKNAAILTWSIWLSSIDSQFDPALPLLFLGGPGRAGSARADMQISKPSSRNPPIQLPSQIRSLKSSPYPSLSGNITRPSSPWKISSRPPAHHMISSRLISDTQSSLNADPLISIHRRSGHVLHVCTDRPQFSTPILGIEMISPHRSNRRADTVTQDGRPLRRYRKRWIVERTISWLGNHRRLLTRHEKHASLFAAFATLGCLMIALRPPPLRLAHSTFRTASRPLQISFDPPKPSPSARSRPGKEAH